VKVAPDLQEFLAAYLLEAEEHVAVANAQLLTLEASRHRGENNPKAVREIFRALHTIKGLSAMVGVEAIVTIAHRLELLLRECERAAAGVSLQGLDALLHGVGEIRARLTALSRGEQPAQPDAPLLARLESTEVTDQAPPAPAPPTIDLEPELLEKLAPFEVEQLLKAAASAQRAIVCEFFPTPDRSARGLSISSVRERVAKVAEIVKVLPRAVPVTPESPGGLAFVLIVLTSATDAELAEAVGVDPATLRVLQAQLPVIVETAAAESKRSALTEFEDEAFGEGLRKGIVRVDVARLDDAMEGLSALIVTRFRLARVIADLKQQGVNTRELSYILADNARQLRDLRAAIVRVRMVPVSELLERVPLLVRGLCRTTNRLVRLEVEGGGAELDKAVSERLFPVIVHLVRNAVDHGIETPDERVRRGKPEEGFLRIVAGTRSNTRLELTLTDDGRGIDAAAVARKARREPPANDAELLEMLCLPGFSTREVATTTSGRGVGMEIVKRVVVGELGGELELRTEFGKGTSFILRVPLTISIVDAFIFESAGQRFVVPVAIVEEIVELERARAVEVPGQAADAELHLIVRRGQAMPVLELAQVLRLNLEKSHAANAIVVRRAGTPIAFGVDRMLGQQEVVIRPMNDVLTRLPGISGATDLGDGRPTLVLDLVALGSATPSRTERVGG